MHTHYAYQKSIADRIAAKHMQDGGANAVVCQNDDLFIIFTDLQPLDLPLFRLFYQGTAITAMALSTRFTETGDTVDMRHYDLPVNQVDRWLEQGFECQVGFSGDENPFAHPYLALRDVLTDTPAWLIVDKVGTCMHVSTTGTANASILEYIDETDGALDKTDVFLVKKDPKTGARRHIKREIRPKTTFEIT